MTTTPTHDTDTEQFDLVLARVVDVSPEKLFKAWTTPELLKQWFVPRPWTIAECEIDPRPGGICHVVMRSPEGEATPDEAGCFLEVVENQRIVMTDALGPGYRPKGGGFMTAVITFEAVDGGTRYTARALHKDAEDRDKHAAMGFHEGWGQCLDQLVEVAGTL